MAECSRHDGNPLPGCWFCRNKVEPAAGRTVCHCEQNRWELRPGDGGNLVICSACGYIALITDEGGSEYSPGISLHRVTLTLCSLCLLGEGGECHVPGCSLWLHAAPDIPVTIETSAARVQGAGMEG